MCDNEEQSFLVAFDARTGKQTWRVERDEKSSWSTPHICQIHDVGPGYLVLEYIDGAPLRGPLAPTEAVRLILQVADALDVRRWAASLLIHSGPSRRSEARRDRVATNGEVALVVRDDGTYQPYFAPQR